MSGRRLSAVTKSGQGNWCMAGADPSWCIDTVSFHSSSHVACPATCRSASLYLRIRPARRLPAAAAVAAAVTGTFAWPRTRPPRRPSRRHRPASPRARPRSPTRAAWPSPRRTLLETLSKVPRSSSSKPPARRRAPARPTPRESRPGRHRQPRRHRSPDDRRSVQALVVGECDHQQAMVFVLAGIALPVRCSGGAPGADQEPSSSTAPPPVRVIFFSARRGARSASRPTTSRAQRVTVVRWMPLPRPRHRAAGHSAVPPARCRRGSARHLEPIFGSGRRAV
jgi:hypothetical protein